MTLNLMDTPGHVDFAYEVSRAASPRAKARCWWSTRRRASRRRRSPTSISRSSTTTRSCRSSTRSTCPPPSPRRCARRSRTSSASTRRERGARLAPRSGIGIDEVLEAIVDAHPAAQGRCRRAAEGDAGRQLVRPLSRRRHPRPRDRRRAQEGPADQVHGRPAPRIWSTASAASAPRSSSSTELGPGEIGFITAQIKEVAQTRVGDTITDAKRPAAEALPGFKEVQPVVFCGLFPVDADDFEKLRDSISKLRLNDASFSFEMETSAPRSASASAAASSACSTSRSSRSG